MSVLRVKNQQGFTLVELLVTITIFVLLTGIVLFNQTKFNSTILLTNLAYDTALTIRQAQNYGINIKEFDTGNGGDFYPYGVHFETGSPKSFILFADIDRSGFFKGTLLDRCDNDVGCVNRYNIKRGNIIENICKDKDCHDKYDKVNIVFKRPNPDALIRFNDDVNAQSDAYIVLGGVDGSTRTVHVQSNGLIEIINQ